MSKSYIDYTGLITLNIDYTKDSDRTLSSVIDIAVERCNAVAEESGVDVKCYVTDHHNGNKYIAYSDNMVAKYDVLTTNWQLDLDMVAINKSINEGDNELDTTELKNINIKLESILSMYKGGWTKHEDGSVTLLNEDGSVFTQFMQIDRNGNAATTGNWELRPIKDIE